MPNTVLSSKYFPGAVGILDSALESKIVNSGTKGVKLTILVIRKKDGYHFKEAPEGAKLKYKADSKKITIPVGDTSIILSRSLFQYGIKTIKKPPEYGDSMLIRLKIDPSDEISIYPILGWDGERI